MLVAVAPEPVYSPVPAGLAGADGDTIGIPPLVRQAVLVDSLVIGPTSTFLSSADGIVDLADKGAASTDEIVEVASDAGAASPAEIAEVAADAGAASPAEIAEVAADAGAASPTEFAEAASLADIAEAASLADIAEAASLADFAEVASSADDGVASLAAIAEAATLAAIASIVATGVAFQEKCDVIRCVTMMTIFSSAVPTAGHSSCELRQYLDSVPPETPIRDVVDRCRVWESHADPEI